MRQRPVILLVDDNPSVRHALNRALAFEDFKVVVAANSQEALRGFQENPVDVVLLDQDLGPESGWDTLELLRKQQPGLPVILMTARTPQRTPHSTQSIQALMEKPLDLPLLFRTLSLLLEQSHPTPFPSGVRPGRLVAN